MKAKLGLSLLFLMAVIFFVPSVAHANPAGGLDNLVASTYLGGSLNDITWSLARDISGNIYITGQTASTNLPTTTGAFQGNYAGGSGNDAFLVKFNSSLTNLLASTYFWWHSF